MDTIELKEMGWAVHCKHCYLLFFHLDCLEDHLRRNHEDRYNENPNVVDHAI